MTLRFTVLLVLTSLMIFSSCRKNGGPSGPDISNKVILPASGSDVVAAENQFAVDIFHQVLIQDSGLNNKMISPLSIYLALGMANLGANGATRDSIQKVLRLGTLSIDDLNATSDALVTQLPNADSKVTLDIANSVWCNQQFTILPSFLNAVQGAYGARAQSLDFSSSSAAARINQWVSDETHQMIPTIIQGTNPAQPAILVNAVYFKGAWKFAFDPGSTVDRPFTLADGVQESVPTMTTLKAETLPYFSNDSISIVQMPYAGGNYNMFALLPAQQLGIRGLMAALNPGSLGNWQQKMDSANLQLYFPSFSFKYQVDDLSPSLKNLGMGIALRDGADFSNMTSSPSFISSVIHKTAIEVTEEGTKAAAATAVGFYSLSVNSGSIPLYFDHPFLFLITEKTSGVILFLGILADPLQGGN